MDDVKELIKLVNSDQLYDAKDKLDKLAKERLEKYKKEITKNLDIFNKKS